MAVFLAAAVYVSVRSVTFGETWCGTLVWDRHGGGPCASSNRNRELLVLGLLGLAAVTGFSLWRSGSRDETTAG